MPRQGYSELFIEQSTSWYANGVHSASVKGSLCASLTIRGQVAQPWRLHKVLIVSSLRDFLNLTSNDVSEPQPSCRTQSILQAVSSSPSRGSWPRRAERSTMWTISVVKKHIRLHSLSPKVPFKPVAFFQHSRRPNPFLGRLTPSEFSSAVMLNQRRLETYLTTIPFSLVLYLLLLRAGAFVSYIPLSSAKLCGEIDRRAP